MAISDQELDALISKVKKLTRRLSSNQLIILCENLL